MAIKIEQISIANRMIDRIQDEEGIYWYPLKSFFTRILFKKEVVREYRDSQLIRYMRVFKLKPLGAKSEVKMWCMNERGLKYVLRHISIGKSRRRARYEDIEELRKKNLVEACLYFGIDRCQELQPNYIQITPNLNDYDIWSIYCFKYDDTINRFTTWRRCVDCGYYYPYNKNYFAINDKKKITTRCMQCYGKDFICQNKIIQFIYENGGLDLLYFLDKGDNDESIIRELLKFINLGGVHTHDH